MATRARHIPTATVVPLMPDTAHGFGWTQTQSRRWMTVDKRRGTRNLFGSNSITRLFAPSLERLCRCLCGCVLQAAVYCGICCQGGHPDNAGLMQLGTTPLWLNENLPSHKDCIYMSCYGHLPSICDNSEPLCQLTTTCIHSTLTKRWLQSPTFPSRYHWRIPLEIRTSDIYSRCIVGV